MKRTISENIVTEVKGNELAIYVKLDGPKVPSKSGKTLIVASTRGAISLQDAGATLNLNLYTGR